MAILPHLPIVPAYRNCSAYVPLRTSFLLVFALLIVCPPSYSIMHSDTAADSAAELPYGSLPALAPDSAGEDALRPDLLRVGVVGTVTAGSLVATYAFQQKAWWLGDRSPFMIKSDMTSTLNFDKLGHLYGGYLLSNGFGSLFRWCGLEERKSVFYGAGASFLYQTSLEVMDGCRKNYGFDLLDELGNLVGAIIPVLQHEVPFFQSFSLKYSYYPSKPYLEELRRGASNRIFIDDYEGMTLWLAVDPHMLTGNGLPEIVPRWIGVAVGYGVRDLDYCGGGRRVFSLALDVNFSRIETESAFLRSLFRALDFLHLPFPGVRYSEGVWSFGVLYP